MSKEDGEVIDYPRELGYISMNSLDEVPSEFRLLVGNNRKAYDSMFNEIISAVETESISLENAKDVMNHLNNQWELRTKRSAEEFDRQAETTRKCAARITEREKELSRVWINAGQQSLVSGVKRKINELKDCVYEETDFKTLKKRLTEAYRGLEDLLLETTAFNPEKAIKQFSKHVQAVNDDRRDTVDRRKTLIDFDILAVRRVMDLYVPPVVTEKI